jgi:hypothetical protein
MSEQQDLNTRPGRCRAGLRPRHGHLAGQIAAIAGLVAAAISPSLPADDFPEGCVSCHVVLGDGMDKRLGVVLDAAGHRPIKGKVDRVPADCLQCHKSLDDPPFSTLVHLAHFSSPDTSVFIERFGGDCRHCHVMDPATGLAGVKTGQRNW